MTKRIPTPQEAAQQATAAHLSARDAMLDKGSSRTDADVLAVSQAGTVAARARAAAAHAERSPEQRAAGAAATSELLDRVPRWFIGADNAKGRHKALVLSPGQFQEWKAGQPVSGLPEGVTLHEHL
jgi:hypothetical protein